MLPYEHGGDVYSNAGIKLDFSVNINPLGMPPIAQRAIADHLADYERYPDPHCRKLCAAIAAGHGVDEAMVLCGNGASDIIFRICACLKPARALTLAPTFSEYARSARLFGSEVRALKLREVDGFELAEAAIPETVDADIIFLCNPNNPTGRLAAPSAVARAAQICARSGALLVVDECFMDFTEGVSAVGLLREYPNLLILRAFTKIYAMAGLRLGYLLCADTDLLERVAAYGAQWNVSVVAQEAGLAALGEPGWVENTRQVVAWERAYLAREFARLGLQVYPGEANYLLLKYEEPLYEPLRARGILVRNCENFSGLDARFIRVGLKMREQNEALIRAIEEIING